MGMAEPPGRPKMYSTPWASRHLIRASAPVMDLEVEVCFFINILIRLTSTTARGAVGAHAAFGILFKESFEK